MTDPAYNEKAVRTYERTAFFNTAHITPIMM